MTKRIFTSESVTEGHPDKVCDIISDSILDACLEQDPMSRVACETLASTGLIVLSGEISAKAVFDYQKIVRDVIKDIGYNSSEFGFDAETCAVLISIDRQSPDIARGVDRTYIGDINSPVSKIGAGDQGIMFGFATNETENYMPVPISLAHSLTKRLTKKRKDGTISYLRPDGKAQVSVEYDLHGRACHIDSIVVSAQHHPDISIKQLNHDIKTHVIIPTLPSNMIDERTKIFINPTGRFVIGGPKADTGLTGRKIIVDTYGGFARHGGGAFSGKDCTKMDRSAAYAARYVAKNLVAAGFAQKIEIQLSYAIGVPEPLSIMVNTYGTGLVSDEEIETIIRREFDLCPDGIIKMLDLRRPIFRQTAAYGHFGRDELDLPWERTNRVLLLQKYL